MSLEERLKEKEKDIAQWINAQDLPAQMELIIVKDEFKEDSTKKECLYITYQTRNNANLKQKYTSSSYAELRESITKAGGFKALTTDFHVYEKRKVGRAFFDRLYPLSTPKVNKPKS